MILIGAANLIMLVGPAIVINTILGMGEGWSLSRSGQSLDLYVQEVAELHGLGTGIILYLLFVSFLVAIIYLVSGASCSSAGPG